MCRSRMPGASRSSRVRCPCGMALRLPLTPRGSAHSGGTASQPRGSSARQAGAVLEQAARRKRETTYPELLTSRRSPHLAHPARRPPAPSSGSSRLPAHRHGQQHTQLSQPAATLSASSCTVAARRRGAAATPPADRARKGCGRAAVGARPLLLQIVLDEVGMANEGAQNNQAAPLGRERPGANPDVSPARPLKRTGAGRFFSSRVPDPRLPKVHLQHNTSNGWHTAYTSSR